MSRSMLIPGPSHPLAIELANRRVTVSQGPTLLADTTAALEVRESTYPAVFYVPRDAFDMALFERSTTTSYCPYKGNCSYFSLRGAGEAGKDIAWTYEEPYPAAAALSHHLAFYPDKAVVKVIT